MDNYPELLTAKHVMQIMGVSRATAYEIMNQPHRPIWRHSDIKGGTLRLHRDLFLEQLREESKPLVKAKAQ